MRSHIVSTIRTFMHDQGYTEVETPMMQSVVGGAAARPFETHHNALGIPLFLRIAPELYLKRLLVGGMRKVFEINRNFRNEGVSKKHNPEFTMLEFYMAHKEYKFGMDFVEELLASIVQDVCGTEVVQYGEHQINFGRPFDRLSSKEALLKYSDCTEDDLDAENDG